MAVSTTQQLLGMYNLSETLARALHDCFNIVKSFDQRWQMTVGY